MTFNFHANIGISSISLNRFNINNKIQLKKPIIKIGFVAGVRGSRTHPSLWRDTHGFEDREDHRIPSTPKLYFKFRDH